MPELDENCRFGAYLIQPAQNTIIKDGDSRQISRRVMDVLMYLIVHHDRVVTQDELLETFWSGRVVEESTIHRQINQIRKLFGDSARNPQYIRTVSKRGYQAIAPVDADGDPLESNHSMPVERPIPAYRGPDAHAFLCYSHADSDVVSGEMTWLREQGVNLWYDDGIAPGSEWSEEIAHAIERSNVFLFMVTPNSQASKHCRDELQFAFANNVPVVGVHLRPTELSRGLRLSLGAVQAVFRYELDAEIYREKLLNALSRYGGRNSATTAEDGESESRRNAPAGTARSGDDSVGSPPGGNEPLRSGISIRNQWKRTLIEARSTGLKVAVILTIAVVLFLYFVQPSL